VLNTFQFDPGEEEEGGKKTPPTANRWRPPHSNPTTRQRLRFPCIRLALIDWGFLIDFNFSF